MVVAFPEHHRSSECQQEIAHVLNRDLANYFLVVGRQLVKSSLLKALEHHLEQQPHLVERYLALADAELGPSLAAALELEIDLANIEANAALQPAIDELSRPNAPVRWLLIDEADEFVAAEAKAGYPTLNLFRKLSEEGRANLMMVACDEIIQHIGNQARLITEEHVDNAFNSHDLQSQLEDWDSLAHNDTRMNALIQTIVYATAAGEPFHTRDIQKLIAKANLPYAVAEIEGALEHLSLAFIIERRAERRYYYCVPLFREMLLELDLERTLSDAIALACRACGAEA